MRVAGTIGHDVTQLKGAMRAIERLLMSLDEEHQERLHNALLNLAVMKMVQADGADLTAKVLHRLADLVGTFPRPSADMAADAASFNS